MAKFKMNFAVIKKHPVTVVIILGGVFIVAWVLLSKGSSTVSAASGPSSAQIAASQQELNNQDAITAQANQNSFQLAYLQQQQVLAGSQNTQSYNLGIATLGAQLTVAQQQLATQLATTEFTTNASTTQLQDQLNAQVTINNQNNSAATAQQATLAQEQEFSIAAQSQVEQLISNNQTLVANNQTNAVTAVAGINANEQMFIAKQNASVQKQNGILGFLGSIL